MTLSRRAFLSLAASAVAIAALPRTEARKGPIDEKGLFVRPWSGGRVRFEIYQNGERLVMPSWKPKDRDELNATASMVCSHGYFVWIVDEGHPDRESVCYGLMPAMRPINMDFDFTDLQKWL
jgi:hypothetical protein